MSRNYSADHGKECPKNLLYTCIALVVTSALIVALLWIIPRPMPEPEYTGPDIQLSTRPTGDSQTDPTPDQGPGQTDPTVPAQPEKVKPIASATIASTGDVLMHMPVVNTGLQGDGSYDFTSIFQFCAPYFTEADYAVANLETTLCGTDNGYKYSGYPCFNCPDEIVDYAKAAGFDMFTTANNHCYDTSTVGLNRTLSVLKDKGMDAIGTMPSAEDPKFVVQDINGIRIGMAAYTYSTTGGNGRPMINGIATKADVQGQINTFDVDHIDRFYTELEGVLQAMEQQGAEAVVLYMHWGFEYQTIPSQHQTQIAQKLCDMGVDVIVGGHPHVIQPVDLVTSTTDPDHKTVCLYSMGNAVSNQRLGNLSSCKTAHTEDGVLFSVTFTKYSDGTVALEGTDLIPCWVNLRSVNGKSQYNILPLDPETRQEWKTAYELTDTAFNAAVNSFDRTMKIVGEGLTECQEYLDQAKQARQTAFDAAA